YDGRWMKVGDDGETVQLTTKLQVVLLTQLDQSSGSTAFGNDLEQVFPAGPVRLIQGAAEIVYGDVFGPLPQPMNEMSGGEAVFEGELIAAAGAQNGDVGLIVGGLSGASFSVEQRTDQQMVGFGGFQDGPRTVGRCENDVPTIQS